MKTLARFDSELKVNSERRNISISSIPFCRPFGSAKERFEQLFYSTADDLRRFLSRRIACPHTVADVMQEVFLKLMGAQTTGKLEMRRPISSALQPIWPLITQDVKSVCLRWGQMALSISGMTEHSNESSMAIVNSSGYWKRLNPWPPPWKVVFVLYRCDPQLCGVIMDDTNP